MNIRFRFCDSPDGDGHLFWSAIFHLWHTCVRILRSPTSDPDVFSGMAGSLACPLALLPSSLLPPSPHLAPWAVAAGDLACYNLEMTSYPQTTWIHMVPRLEPGVIPTCGLTAMLKLLGQEYSHMLLHVSLMIASGSMLRILMAIWGSFAHLRFCHPSYADCSKG